MNINNFRYAEDAMRFFGGTPSPAPYACALNALKLWQDIGTPFSKIQVGLSELTNSAPEHMVVSPNTPSLRGGTFVLAPQSRDTLRTSLNAQNIQYDERNEGFRFSIHAYTTTQDIDILKSILARL